MKTISFFTLFFISILSTAQVTINITSVPANTPVNDDIYVAGSFNGWNPGSIIYKLTKINSSLYTITLNGSGSIEFKFTRGDWNRVECNSNGSDISNRTFTYGNDDTLNLSIAGWHDLINGGESTSTALQNVSVMDDNFFIPQLNRTRKIWIYLPDDYNTALNKYYPVLYMQDGQNVFDDSTSFAGEWKVDETLHTLQMDGDYGCIVIAIENDGVHRIDEYSPYTNPSYGGGEGDEYADFIVNTLKPYVDLNYRTLTARDYTAIAGSSMGALISFYAAMKYQSVFSKAGIFSPSFWFDDSLNTFVANEGKQQEMKFYFVSGTNESTDMVPDIRSMYSTMSNDGFTTDEMDTVFVANGAHAEWFWAQEFGACYNWLFDNTIISVEEPEPDSIFNISPNPAQKKINLASKYPMKKIEVEIFDSNGQRIFTSSQQFSKSIDVSKMKNGLYYLKIKDQGKIYSKIFAVMK